MNGHRIAFLVPEDISALEKELLASDGRLKVISSEIIRKYPQRQLSLFCVKHGFYGLVTSELIFWLKEQIAGRKALEVGAGNGALGQELNIPMTDSFLQEEPEIKAYYQSLNQSLIHYGPDVEKADYKDAILKYKPDVVIASWVTQLWLGPKDNANGSVYGIDEGWILDHCRTYIHIGNASVHGAKRILSHKHDEYKFDWLYSRSLDQNNCVIYVWNNPQPTSKQ